MWDKMKNLYEELVAATKIPGGKYTEPKGAFKVWLESPEGKKELAKGIKVELEHTKDQGVAREIAVVHLKEDKEYYKKLAKVGLDEAAMGFGGNTCVSGNPGDKGTGVPVMQPNTPKKMKFYGDKLKMGKPGKGMLSPNSFTGGKSSFAKGTM
jgi:hypothetical protein